MFTNFYESNLNFIFEKKKPISRLCCEDYDNLSHVAYNIVLRYSLLTKLFQMYWTELYGRQQRSHTYLS